MRIWCSVDCTFVSGNITTQTRCLLAIWFLIAFLVLQTDEQYPMLWNRSFLLLWSSRIILKENVTTSSVIWEHSQNELNLLFSKKLVSVMLSRISRRLLYPLYSMSYQQSGHRSKAHVNPTLPLCRFVSVKSHTTPNPNVKRYETFPEMVILPESYGATLVFQQRVYDHVGNKKFIPSTNFSPCWAVAVAPRDSQCQHESK